MVVKAEPVTAITAFLSLTEAVRKFAFAFSFGLARLVTVADLIAISEPYWSFNLASIDTTTSDWSITVTEVLFKSTDVAEAFPCTWTGKENTTFPSFFTKI